MTLYTISLKIDKLRSGVQSINILIAAEMFKQNYKTMQTKRVRLVAIKKTLKNAMVHLLLMHEKLDKHFITLLT